MDYEKKYKSLVEAVKTLKEANPSDDGIQNWVNDNVPELAESEDERIRKWIIAYLENRVMNTSITDEKDNCLGAIRWLKKQDEQKPIDVRTTGYWNVQEVEQKPADKVEPKFKAGDKIIGTISNIPYYITKVCNGHYLTDVGCIIMFNAQDNFELSNQTTTWSEEDGKIVEALNAYVKNLDMFFSEIKIGDKNIPSKEFREKVQYWLKSLKVRVQPKQKWGEEDERHINDIMWCIEAYKNNAFNKTHIDIANRAESWLKSLRPQNHWKPSDEQMEALLYEVNAWDEDSVNGQNLKSLYQDLKKLREE